MAHTHRKCVSECVHTLNLRWRFNKVNPYSITNHRIFSISQSEEVVSTSADCPPAKHSNLKKKEAKNNFHREIRVDMTVAEVHKYKNPKLILTARVHGM